MARNLIFDINGLPVNSRLPYFSAFVFLLASVVSLRAAGELPIADLYFKDGRVERHVTILSRTETKIKCLMSYGEITFLVSTIERTDPANAGVTSPPPSRAVSGAAAPSTSESQPAATTAEPAPAETPAEPVPAVATGSASSAVAVPAVEPVADASAATPNSSTGTSSDDRKFSPKFEFLLLCFLVLAAIWLRTVQWVQKHLAARKADPRFWTLVALFLPGVGAVAYAAMLRMTGQNAAVEPESTPASHPARRFGQPSAPTSAPVPVAPSVPPRVPATPPPGEQKPKAPEVNVGEIVRNIRTPRGFEFIDAVTRFSSVDANFASKLGKAGEMIDEALFERASDVHIEPTAEDCRVRFRLEGLLQERNRYGKADGDLVLGALKAIAKLDTEEVCKPQEGRFQMRSGDRVVDLRLATASSFHGEKMVIRLVDHSLSGFTMSTLGLDVKSTEVLSEALQSRDGAILVTGPSGSGRTSTLYAALRTIDSKRLNVMTIEDPPEYELAGTTQLSVNPKAGITYENGLQSLMRQDPDVIMVGEMRDAETMKIAFSAVIAGHLLLSSFNALGALSTITQLREMGIENYQIASAVRIILCQRLVRVLCPHCRHPFPANGGELLSLGMELEAGSILHAATGCERCQDTGYSGREGLFEMLVIDEALRRAITDGADEGALAAIAVNNGFHSYHYTGAQKVLAGITTVEELLKTEQVQASSNQ